MQYVKLGRTGLDVSRLCLGCMSYGAPDRGGHTWTLPEAEARPFIKAALEHGITFFDTANVYSDGSSEEIVGRALKDFARRDEVVVATKVQGRMRPGPNGAGLSRAAIMMEIDNSLRRLGMEFFLQVDASKHKGWDHRVQTEIKRVRRHVQTGQPVARTLAQIVSGWSQAVWKPCSWVAAGGQTRKTRLAWGEVFLQQGLQRPEGQLEALWLVVDWPAGDSEPYHYYLAHLHRPPTRALCLKLSRSRWHVEQYFQRSKTDLGLDHFEGRSWQGFHHHLVLSAIAYLFILSVYLRSKKNFWCDVGTDSPPDPALAGESERLLRLLSQQV